MGISKIRIHPSQQLNLGDEAMKLVDKLRGCGDKQTLIDKYPVEVSRLKEILHLLKWDFDLVSDLGIYL